jgi:lipid A 3-O-deacylase
MPTHLRALIAGILLLSQTTLFASQTGIMLSYPLETKDPSDLHGYKGSIWYQPTTFEWGNAHLLFDASFGHWWVDNYPTNREINIGALAPVFRYYMLSDQHYLNPFIDISIGVAYLSETRFADRNLGMHFSFQDQLGFGASFGPQHRLFASVYAVHYSNCSMSSMNAGITIPIVLNVGYRF